ncbi:MAG TPA: glycosyl hydrolase family 18 protein [Candidatus Dormibacteraeota bacterium]|jgi:spore germination protein YaaH|nr:glycosyl hydrolase family 18 protein [Candidatus Dormibacteraeota bacterium]
MPGRRAAAAASVCAVLLGGCGGAEPAATPPPATGAVVVNAGGHALVDGSTSVPPTLDLRVTAARALDGDEGKAELDGRQIHLRPQGGALVASVAAMPLGSAHHLDLDVVGRGRHRLGFHVVRPAGAMAAVHADPRDGTVLDVALELAPADRAAVEAAVPGGVRVWQDDRHLRVFWPKPPGGELHLPVVPTELGSHLVAPVTLDLSAVPPGQVRMRVVPTAPPPPPPRMLLAFSVATTASRASVAAHLGQLSVLSPTGLVAHRDGSLTGAADPPAVASASAGGVPVWPLIQNSEFDSAEVAALLEDDAAGGRLVGALRAAAAEGGYGGIDLDFESVPPADRDHLSSFISKLGAGLHADGRRLAVAVVPHKPGRLNFYSGAYDLASILHSADLVTLMAYEEHGPSTVPGPVAGLDWDRQLLQGSLDHLSGTRALLGMPFYARSWTLTGAPADGYAPAVSAALGGPGARVDYDFGASTPYIQGGAGDSVTYFDDADSLARKLALAAQTGMAGTAVWRLGFEDPAIWSLLPTKPPKP